MKISTNWLNEYVPVTVSATELADRLTMAGLEIEAVVNPYEHLNTIIVGKVTDVKQHPNAEKLSLCQVNIGDQNIDVVCGAPNVSVDMRVPCALPGTTFPGGMVIKKSTIRGVGSEGMLCSEAELELGQDGSGILELPPDLKAGTPITTALDLSDIVLEIDLTPNRPDCLSYTGVAREVAALLGQPLTLPEIKLPEAAENITDFTSVTIEDPELCPRYAARLLTDITVAPSPFWLQNRLLAAGAKPINNIVDITNFVMLELGQPLHAFDFDRLAENRIVVRAAKENEKFVTLDEKERVMNHETLMICDGEKPVAVAGVMGGENSEIENITTRVLIESAYFNPISIRKTAKRLGLNTDASHRFERGVDPDGTLTAVNRAAQLMAKIAGGRLVDGIIDEHPLPSEPKAITLSIDKTNRHLGTQLSQPEIVKHLKSIEFKVEMKDADSLVATPPTFRVDVSRPEDLMEEVARLWGYNNIKTTFPAISSDTSLPTRAIEIKEYLKDLMAGFGFSEDINYSFIAKDACDRLELPQDDVFRQMLDILNPLSEDQAVMRTSLIPGLLQTGNRNIARQIVDLKIFELGKIFLSHGQDQQPEEVEILSALWTGSRDGSTWNMKPDSCDFFDLKGVIEGLFQSVSVNDIYFSQMPADKCSYTRAGHTAEIFVDQNMIGHIGEVKQSVLEQFGISQAVFVFEINVSALIPLLPEITTFKPIPKFPSVDRDITLIVDNHIQAGDIVNKVKLLQESLMEDISIFDIYTGNPIPTNKKSISLRITYRSHTETLSDNQINIIHRKITDELIKAFGADLPA